MEQADRRFWIEAGDAALAGFALVILGLLVLAALGGWLFGRRQGGPRPTVPG